VDNQPLWSFAQNTHTILMRKGMHVSSTTEESDFRPASITLKITGLSPEQCRVTVSSWSGYICHLFVESR